MIIVTGATGFIGSNIVADLNAAGRSYIILIDNLGTQAKWKNIAKRRFQDVVLPSELDSLLRKLPGVTVFPSDANFILVRVPDAAKVFEGMRRRGVLVKNLHTGVPLLDHCVRLTIGTPEENRRCLAAFAQALAEG